MTEDELKLIEARAAREGSWFPTLTEDSQDLAITCQRDIPTLVAEIRSLLLQIRKYEKLMLFAAKELDIMKGLLQPKDAGSTVASLLRDRVQEARQRKGGGHKAVPIARDRESAERRTAKLGGVCFPPSKEGRTNESER